MADNDIDKVEPLEENEQQPEILVNDYGQTIDPAVVVEEADRTVLLTPDETIVFEKQPAYDIAPKDRPRKIYAGMWGPAEIATVGVAMLAMLTAILVWVFLVIPSNKELEQNRAERDRLEQELLAAKAKYGDITNTETHAAKLMTSVGDFELNYLPAVSTGRNALYQRLNGLIGAYGLINTNGPDYTPLETLDSNIANQSEEERGRAKYRSLFPGVYVTTTVEGPYQNIRRFIREVETGSDFVVISAVEIEPSDSPQEREAAKPGTQGPYDRPGQQMAFPEPGIPGMPGQMPQAAQQTQQTQPRRGKTQGETVSLRIEMAAYFRRPNFVPPIPEAPAN